MKTKSDSLVRSNAVTFFDSLVTKSQHCICNFILALPNFLKPNTISSEKDAGGRCVLKRRWTSQLQTINLSSSSSKCSETTTWSLIDCRFWFAQCQQNVLELSHSVWTSRIHLMFLQKKRIHLMVRVWSTKEQKCWSGHKKGAELLKAKGILMSSLLRQHCPAISSALQENPGYSMLSLKKEKGK